MPMAGYANYSDNRLYDRRIDAAEEFNAMVEHEVKNVLLDWEESEAVLLDAGIPESLATSFIAAFYDNVGRDTTLGELIDAMGENEKRCLMSVTRDAMYKKAEAIVTDRLDKGGW